MTEAYKAAIRAARHIKTCKTKHGRKRAIHAWADAARKMLGA